MKFLTIGGEIATLETLELDSFVCKETGKNSHKALFISNAGPLTKEMIASFGWARSGFSARKQPEAAFPIFQCMSCVINGGLP